MGKIIILLLSLFMLGCAPRNQEEVRIPLVVLKQFSGMPVTEDDYKTNDIVFKANTVWFSKDRTIRIVKNGDKFILEISNNLDPEVAGRVKESRLEAIEEAIVSASDLIKKERGN